MGSFGSKGQWPGKLYYTSALATLTMFDILLPVLEFWLKE